MPGACYDMEFTVDPIAPTMHADVRLHIVPQWCFGASVPKSTGLLAMRIPAFLKSLYALADSQLKKPKAVAIGRNSDGRYRTNQHKEYPQRFCAALARCVTDQLDSDMRSGSLRVSDPAHCTEELLQWIREASCDHTQDSRVVARFSASTAMTSLPLPHPFGQCPKA
eukprot:s1696_g4.t1